MSRYIDGDALAKFIDYGHLNNPNEKLYSENDIREMIDMMPTMDAVPVVRCKDCKYYEEQDETIGTCLLTESGAHIKDYCSWAEVKEE